MAITQGQIAQAIAAASALEVDISQLLNLLRYIQGLANNGWQYTTQYTNTTYAISNADQTALLAIYTGIKNQLVADFGNLP